jgi:hypothetical protein
MKNPSSSSTHELELILEVFSWKIIKKKKRKKKVRG